VERGAGNDCLKLQAGRTQGRRCKSEQTKISLNGRSTGVESSAHSKSVEKKEKVDCLANGRDWGGRGNR